MWATGILAYELLVGKPPFEVKNEAQTVNRILTCTNISLPARHSLLWADFVKQGLEKRPHFRPDAATLLDHPCAPRSSPVSLFALFRHAPAAYDPGLGGRSHGRSSTASAPLSWTKADR